MRCGGHNEFKPLIYEKIIERENILFIYYFHTNDMLKYRLVYFY